MRPDISTTLTDAVAELAAFFRTRPVRPVVVPDAPETLAQLRSDPRLGRIRGRWRTLVPVSGEFCDRTIYADPTDNHWARAWHDSVHLRLGTEFDASGEIKTGMAQLREAYDWGLSADALAVLYADTVGQTLYYERNGFFPDNAAPVVAADAEAIRPFILDLLKNDSSAGR